MRMHATGEHLALPQEAVDYFHRLPGLDDEYRYTEWEREAWIIIAAQVPTTTTSPAVAWAFDYVHSAGDDHTCASSTPDAVDCPNVPLRLSMTGPARACLEGSSSAGNRGFKNLMSGHMAERSPVSLNKSVKRSL
ncbi:hypothetical protein ACFW6Q_26715 [Streptomyces sp. NPDC058737]|uniref:hypothetical protein n=1 Tax=Streptomyces sp. NPDC058737 TaxID=3346617 RepID=UPI00367FDB43